MPDHVGSQMGQNRTDNSTAQKNQPKSYTEQPVQGNQPQPGHRGHLLPTAEQKHHGRCVCDGEGKGADADSQCAARAPLRQEPQQQAQGE